MLADPNSYRFVWWEASPRQQGGMLCWIGIVGLTQPDFLLLLRGGVGRYSLYKCPS